MPSLPHQEPDRLSQIQTNWAEVFRANDDQSSGFSNAQHEMLLRYAGAVYRYLLSAVRDPNIADELAQEFALKVVRGDFRNADPQRGRFRDFVKRSLFNLVTDFHRKRQKQSISLGTEVETLAWQPTEPFSRTFDENWRIEILNRTWKALDEADVASKSCYSAVLKQRAQNPDLDSNALAERVSTELGCERNAAWVRQTLHRARSRFCQLLRIEVGKTLGSHNDDEIDEELASLRLLKYSR
ncbi:RNA polymerase sigma factor [Stieleria varia]|uniref:RNA polymerase sigma factor n=1 Tax=Stieleria varia TaxID=2528005 RepID=A0A5C6BAI1_9BACT|nr:sigma factor [Stieleria varia]TWU08289.1 RNA polymerase sigma factor [Stieleria varia]